MAGVAGVLCLAVAVAVIVLATSAGGSSGGYTVHAIFDDAANVISGEDVKVDGVKVGTVGSVQPTPGAQAAVTLKIDNPGFQDFRSDATCTIKPQALIGEKFVDCLPTQPRAEGAQLPPPLHKIPHGREGAGDYLLPVQNTSSPVDIDLLGDITRLPERQRLTILINELGAGLAGRGKDLNEVIRRAEPGLKETNKVLGILASENKILANLAEESDKALAPLAHVRGQVADFISQANTVSTATAKHRGAVSQGLAELPAFLHQLEPALKRLGKFADQTTPVFEDLNVAAPGVNKTFENLGPFSTSSTKFFKTLGNTAKTSGPALVGSQPLLTRLQSLGSSAQPFSGNLSTLLTSLRETGGLERLLDFVFLGANATNGYDALGHFIRASVVAKTCVGYAVVPGKGCKANFIDQSGEGSATEAKASSAKASTSIVMNRTLAVLDGKSPAEAIAEYPGTVPPLEGGSQAGAGAGSTPASTTEPVGGSSAGTTYYAPSSESSQAGGMLLNYLLGE